MMGVYILCVIFLSYKASFSKKYRLSTLSDMLELRYQSKALKMLTALTIVCFNIVWLLSEIKTLGFAMNIASGGGIPIGIGSAIAFSIISQIVPCVIGGLYWRKATPQAAIASLLIGVGSYLIMDTVVRNLEINMGGLMLGLPALAVSITVFIVVSLCTHKKYYEKNEKFNGIYSDFFEKGRVNAYIKKNF